MGECKVSQNLEKIMMKIFFRNHYSKSFSLRQFADLSLSHLNFSPEEESNSTRTILQNVSFSRHTVTERLTIDSRSLPIRIW